MTADTSSKKDAKKTLKKIIISIITIGVILSIAVGVVVLAFSQNNSDTITTKYWETTIGHTEIVYSVKDGVIEEKPEDGSVYIITYLTIKNVHTLKARFDPISGKEQSPAFSVVYKDKYTFKPTKLFWAGSDITMKELNPLQQVEGYVVFEVPQEVVEGNNTKIVIRYENKTKTVKPW